MRAQLEQPECGGTGRYSGTPSGLSTAATGAARRELASPSTQARQRSSRRSPSPTAPSSSGANILLSGWRRRAIRSEASRPCCLS